MVAAGISRLELDLMTQLWRPLSRIGLPLKTWAMCFPNAQTLGAAETRLANYAEALARQGHVLERFAMPSVGGGGGGLSAPNPGPGAGAPAAQAVQSATANTAFAALDSGRAAQALASTLPPELVQALQLLLKQLPKK